MKYNTKGELKISNRENNSEGNHMLNVKLLISCSWITEFSCVKNKKMLFDTKYNNSPF